MAGARRVLICGSVVPFVSGGAELHVEGLERAVAVAGYDVDVVNIPYSWDPPDRIVKTCLTWRLLDVERSPAGKTDLVIATKFPTYAVAHNNKVAWVFHQHRSLYDLKGTIYDDFAHYDNAEEYREALKRMDMTFLSECKRVFATSENVASRLSKYCGQESDVVYHPPPFEGRYRSEDYGDDVLVVGRLEPLKRVDLAIRAMKYMSNRNAVLRVVGTGFLETSLRDLAASHGVADRVRFEGFVSDEDLLELYSRAGCVVYVPFDEDYGYATLEAFKSKRPVAVTDDSGGPLEFVRDGETGRVVPALPEALAEAMDDLLGDGRKAKRFGKAGFEAVEGIGWENVIETLVEPFLA